MIINLLLTLIIIVILLIIYRLYLFYTYWSRNGVKGPNLFQSLRIYISKVHEYDFEAHQKYGPICGYYEIMSRGIYVNDPDLAKDILVRDFHHFPNHRSLWFGELIGLSLFLQPGSDNWRRIRSIISPSFTSSKLRSMMKPMSGLADNFCKNLEKEAIIGKPFDIKRYIDAFVMDAIASCAYGVNVDSLSNPNHPMVGYAKNTFGYGVTLPFIFGVLAPPVAKFLKLQLLNSETINYFQTLTKKIVENRESLISDKKRSDFIQLMVDACDRSERKASFDNNSDELDKESAIYAPIDSVNSVDVNQNISDRVKNHKTLTEKEMTAQGILFFLAGYDTTGPTIAHCLHLLASNPQCQQKLYNEINNLEDFNHESLSKLVYLNAVIMETLRMSPPGSRIERECVKDYKLGNTGITIPAGTTVSISNRALHYSPENFENPNEFRPERFIKTETYVPSHHPYSYIPFGSGQRNCLGMNFALNELRMCVTKTIKTFKLSLGSDKKLEYFNTSIMLVPKEVMVLVVNRY